MRGKLVVCDESVRKCTFVDVITVKNLHTHEPSPRLQLMYKVEDKRVCVFMYVLHVCMCTVCVHVYVCMRVSFTLFQPPYANVAAEPSAMHSENVFAMLSLPKIHTASRECFGRILFFARGHESQLDVTVICCFH